MLDQRFKKYIEEKYYNDIYNAINPKIEKDYTLDDFYINNIFISDKFNLEFSCICIINVVLKDENCLIENQRNSIYKVEFDGYFTGEEIKCTKFRANIDDGTFIKNEYYLDTSFLPHIKKERFTYCSS